MSLFSSNEERYCTPFALHDSMRNGNIDIDRLEPEDDFGNVEYKLRLTDPTPSRIEKLVTQLKWRIREGNGEAIVYLGVRDDGIFVGLTPEEMRLSIKTLETMTSKIGAKMTVVKERIVARNLDNQVRQNNIDPGLNQNLNLSKNRTQSSARRSVSKENYENISDQEDMDCPSDGIKINPVRRVIQVLVKRKTFDITDELRVAAIGPTESGKSTLLGVLSHGKRDNGRGSARLNLFRHRHEVRSGHTSSICQEILGFDDDGQPLTYQTCLSTEELIESSAKVVTLIDLAGHQRYLSTTLFGLGSYSPDLILLIINAATKISNAITESISLALGIEKPVAIVLNKVDLISETDKDKRYNDIVQIIHSIDQSMTAVRVNSLGDAVELGAKLDESNLVPIFCTSCITGLGLTNLYAFMNNFPPLLNSCDLSRAANQSVELLVDETFDVPGIGTVVSGLVIEGTVREKDEMWIGPDNESNFSRVTVVSMQRHKMPCSFARAGQKCTMAILAPSGLKVRPGMVMKEYNQDVPRGFSACLRFKARVKIIGTKQYRLNPGSQVYVYVANVKQTCLVESIESSSEAGLLITLCLTKRPEYIRENRKLIIRLGPMKGIGEVCEVYPIFSRS